MAAKSPATTDRTAIDEWVDQRVHWRQLFAAAVHVRVPAKAQTFFFGGALLFLIGVQVVTGTLLALYFKPTPESAYDSVLYLTSDVRFGWLIRSVHHWGANLMILFLALHLLRIFFQAAYKYPRELTWLVGIALLAITMGFGFTGYLLPWDQRAYWATTVGTEIAGSVPVIGHSLLTLLRDGEDITDATMTRFFGIHVLALPLALGGIVLAHLLFVHQHGLANPTRPDPRPPELPQGQTKAFFPDYILEESIAWLVLLAILVVLASLFPAGLDDPADPLNTPAHTKPEWYFLSVYELLKHVPRTVGVLAPGVFMAVLAILPFVDRNPEVRLVKRPLAVLLGLATLGAVVGLTIMGYRS